MWRPRLCFANADPGGLGEPSVPTTRRCLQWLDGAGEGWGNLPGWRACSRLCRKLGPKDEEVAATERPKGAFLLPRRVVRRSVSPQKGERTKSPTRAAARGCRRLAV